MKTGCCIPLFSIFLFLIQLPVISQESHYWAQQQGSISTLMGGASVASVRDNSSIFYNPGGIVFNESSSLSISASTYFLNSLVLKDGAGTNLDLNSSALDIIPSIIAGVVKDFKKPGRDFDLYFGVCFYLEKPFIIFTYFITISFHSPLCNQC